MRPQLSELHPTGNMVMTQSYYGAREDGSFPSTERSSHRILTGGYYERAVPYTYYPSRHDPRLDDGGQQMNHTVIHEPLDQNAGHSRRRVTMACIRCRKRKIKCTGDPMNGTGCQSCRNSASDIASCNFVRAGVKQISDAGLIRGVNPSTPGHQARPSLPRLQTRPNVNVDYESFDPSPTEGYNLSPTMHRHDSFFGSYSAENYRSWPMSQPTTATFCEPHTSYASHATMPAYQPMNEPLMPYTFSTMPRLSNAGPESPLSLGSLNSTLPYQTVQERRLPAPYNGQRPSTPQTVAGFTEIRPLDGAYDGRRDHINGIHSRHRDAMPWSNGGGISVPNASAPAITVEPSREPMTPTPATHSRSTSASDPVLGYQFNNTDSNGSTMTSNSPHDSSGSAPSQPETYNSGSSNSSFEVSTMSMPPAPRWTTTAPYQPIAPFMTSAAEDTILFNSRGVPFTSLYSFSSESAALAGRSFPTSNERERTTINCHSYAPLRHPQPVHAASVESLRRQPSLERLTRSPAVAHRVSMSNLNGRYA